jgi:ABC-type branched-subunit amino acid transport system ATPase component
MYTPEIESTILEVPRHTTGHTIFESSEIGQVRADERVKCKVMHVLNH